MKNQETPKLTKKLRAACLLGKQEAWRELWALFHGNLVTALALRYDRGPRNPDHDGLATRVLQSLWEKDCRRLKLFRGTPGGFLGYLVALARHEWLDEARLRHHQMTGAGALNEETSSGTGEQFPYELMLTEFASQLSAGERRYLKENFICADDSCPNRKKKGPREWKLDESIRKKLRRYLEDG